MKNVPKRRVGAPSDLATVPSALTPKRRTKTDYLNAVPPPWTHKDSEAALKEGWDVWNNSKYGMEIERLDSRMLFPSDEAAWEFVKERAEEGSELHRKAWIIHLEGILRCGV